MKWEYKYFSVEEMSSRDVPGSGVEMNMGFMLMLDNARGIAGTVFKVNSGYRTPEHNKRVGGVVSSSHVRGLACDISFSTDKQLLNIIFGLYSVGFVRIGLNYDARFVHVDLDKEKPQVRWGYKK